MSIDFILISIVVILVPGTGVIYTLAVGLNKGFSASIAAAFGCTLGIVPAAIAAIAGLAAVLHASALAFQTFKYLGVVYLLYMAWNILRDDATFESVDKKSDLSPLRIIINGMLLNILNPKLSIFFLAFLPQFVGAENSNATTTLIILAAVFMLLTFIIFIAYGGFASLLRDYVITKPRVMLWLRRSFAGAFGILGLKLAFTDR